MCVRIFHLLPSVPSFQHTLETSLRGHRHYDRRSINSSMIVGAKILNTARVTHINPLIHTHLVNTYIHTYMKTVLLQEGPPAMNRVPRFSNGGMGLTQSLTCTAPGSSSIRRTATEMSPKRNKRLVLGRALSNMKPTCDRTAKGALNPRTREC